MTLPVVAKAMKDERGARRSVLLTSYIHNSYRAYLEYEYFRMCDDWHRGCECVPQFFQRKDESVMETKTLTLDLM